MKKTILALVIGLSLVGTLTLSATPPKPNPPAADPVTGNTAAGPSYCQDSNGEIFQSVGNTIMNTKDTRPQSREEACGKCGTRVSECLDGGTWGSWGSCKGEVQDGCTPLNTQEKVEKGITYSRTCSNECGWNLWIERCVPGKKQSKVENGVAFSNVCSKDGMWETGWAPYIQYKNFRWKMSVQEAAKLVQGKKPKTTWEQPRATISYKDTLNGNPIRVYLNFFKNQLFEVNLIFIGAGDDEVLYEQFTQLLTEKYGPPTAPGDSGNAPSWVEETTYLDIGFVSSQGIDLLVISYDYLPLMKENNEYNRKKVNSEL